MLPLLQSSRLHFIGTWRNRYRKRFPSLSNGFRSGGSSLYTAGSSLKTSVANEKNVVIHIDMVSMLAAIETELWPFLPFFLFNCFD